MGSTSTDAPTIRSYAKEHGLKPGNVTALLMARTASLRTPLSKLGPEDITLLEEYYQLGQEQDAAEAPADTSAATSDDSAPSEQGGHPEGASPEGAPDASEAPAEETQGVSSARSGRTYKPGTVGAIIAEYRDKTPAFGQKLTVRLVDAWFPHFKGGRPELQSYHVLEEGQQAELRYMLDILFAIDDRLRQDIAALEDWEIPNPGDMIGLEEYNYLGICGHNATISRRLVVERLANTNSKVPPFFRLCADDRAQRAALLNMVPGSAGPDSVCGVCGHATFTTGAKGFAKSRADIWENLLSGVLGVLNLPLRLSPEHLDSDGRHQALIQNREAFDRWMEELTIQVSLSISAYPALGQELKARLAKDIEAKRLELGIPEEG